MPGPTIQVNEGDRVRIMLHNNLPEGDYSTSSRPGRLPDRHGWHPVPDAGTNRPGSMFSCEFTVHQTGTYFYHSHYAMQEAFGMVGLFIIHPKKAWVPTVDQDFALIRAKSSAFGQRPIFHKPWAMLLFHFERPLPGLAARANGNGWATVCEFAC